jgi:hypothetical protein
MNLAPDTGCRLCHRSPAEVIFNTGPASGEPVESVGVGQPDGVGVDEAAPAQRPRATPVADPPRGPGPSRDSPPIDREPDAGRLEGSGGRRVLDPTVHDPHALVRIGRSSS